MSGNEIAPTRGWTDRLGAWALLEPYLLPQSWWGRARTDDFCRFSGVPVSVALALFGIMPVSGQTDRQNCAPTCADFVEVAKAYPGMVLLAGSIVGSKHEDERVMFDGVLVASALMTGPLPVGVQDSVGCQSWRRVFGAAVAPPDEARRLSGKESGWFWLWWD